MSNYRPEDWRRKANLAICWIAWVSSIIIALWVVSDPDRRPYGIVCVLLIGVGVTASLTRSRYKLADTIAQVLQAGIRIGRAEAHNEHHDHLTPEQEEKARKIPPRA